MTSRPLFTSLAGLPQNCLIHLAFLQIEVLHFISNILLQQPELVCKYLILRDSALVDLLDNASRRDRSDPYTNINTQNPEGKGYFLDSV
jgi:hypothetical protein